MVDGTGLDGFPDQVVEPCHILPPQSRGKQTLRGLEPSVVYHDGLPMVGQLKSIDVDLMREECWAALACLAVLDVVERHETRIFLDESVDVGLSLGEISDPFCRKEFCEVLCDGVPSKRESMYPTLNGIAVNHGDYIDVVSYIHHYTGSGIVGVEGEEGLFLEEDALELKYGAQESLGQLRSLLLGDGGWDHHEDATLVRLEVVVVQYSVHNVHYRLVGCRAVARHLECPSSRVDQLGSDSVLW